MNRRWQDPDRTDLGEQLLTELADQDWGQGWHGAYLVVWSPKSSKQVRIPTEWILDPRDRESLRTMIEGLRHRHGLNWGTSQGQTEGG